MAVRYASSEYHWWPAPVTGAPFTLFCWISIDAGTAAFGSTGPAIRVAATTGEGWYPLIISDTDWRVRVDDSGGDTTLAPSGSEAVDQWNRWTLVEAASNDRTFLYNDVSVANATSRTPTTSGLEIYLRAHAGSPFNAAEYAVWDVALSAEEYGSLNQLSPLLVRPESLVFYAPLVNSTVDLISGSAATASGSPTFVDHPPGIIYPSQPLIIPAAAAAAATGGPAPVARWMRGGFGRRAG